MSELSRRRFLGVVAAAPAGVVLGDLFVEPDDRALLHALAAVVLPAELGAANVKRMAERFERWVSGYRAGAESNHGYGTGRITQLPPDPWPRWRDQLRALETDSQRLHTKSFTALSIDVRRALVEPQLAAEDRIPSMIGAPHVALALLSWFLSTPEATDLCYHARIGKSTCRPLAETVNKPRPS